MAKYELRADEVVLVQAVPVRWRNGKHGGTDELILTNLHLIVVDRGLLGRAEYWYLPLDQVKIFNEQPQALATKGSDGRWQLEVFLLDRQEIFAFDAGGRRAAVKWADAICAVVSGRGAGVQQRANFAIPGTERVVETLRDTVSQAARSLRRAKG